MNRIPRYHIIIRILTCPILGKLLPIYGATSIDRLRKQNGYGHWFLYHDIDGVVLTVADAKLNTGNFFFWRKSQLKYTPN